MKKNKKIKNKNEATISFLDLQKYIFLFNDCLIQEYNIKYKKDNNIPLSSKEQFFDKFLISPSLLLNVIEKRSK